MTEVLGKKEEKVAEKELTVKMDNSDEIVVTIDDSSGDDDEEMIVEDMIVKEDNDLDVSIKSEADDDSDYKDMWSLF